MWADTLLELERGHLLRLGLWSGASAAIGALLLALLLWRRVPATLLQHFAIQAMAWGVVNLGLFWLAWRGLGLRDFSSAQVLVNYLWLNVGLAVGYMLVGITLTLASWRMGPRPAGIGAGVGILLQGAMLFILDVRLIVLIGPLR